MCVYVHVCYVVWYTSTLAEHACHRNNKLTKLPVPGTKKSPFQVVFQGSPSNSRNYIDNVFCP